MVLYRAAWCACVCAAWLGPTQGTLYYNREVGLLVAVVVVVVERRGRERGDRAVLAAEFAEHPRPRVLAALADEVLVELLVEGVEPKFLEALSPLLSTLIVPEREEIVSEGKVRGDNVFFVQRGRLQVWKRSG